MTPEQIEGALQCDDPEARRAAVVAMSEHPNVANGFLLMRALGDTNWRVREETVRVGAELYPGIDVVSDLVIAICQGENVGLRNSALALIAALGRATHEALRRALREVDPNARKFVLEALAAAGEDDVVPILVEHLESGDPNTVAAALDALAVVGGPAGERALRGVLTWKDAFQRMAAMDALNRIGAVVPWIELEPLLNDRLVFRVALSALGRTGDERAIGSLVSALSDRSARVLADAAAAIEHFVEANPDALVPLEDKLASVGTDARGRLAAVNDRHSLQSWQGAALLLCLLRDPRGLDSALGLVAGEGICPTLQRALLRWGEDAVDRLLEEYVQPASPRAMVALELAATLAEELGSEIKPALLSRLQAELRKGLFGTDPELQLVAARAIGPFAEPADSLPLVQAAGSADYELAEACGSALVELAEREADAVREALSQCELSGAGLEAVAGLLVELEGDKALRRFQAALLLDDPATRCAALSGLAKLGGERAAELIALALTDESLEVQLAAAESLGKLPDELGVAPLLLCLDADSTPLRAAVAKALGDCGSPRAVEPLRTLMESGTDDSAVHVSALSSLHKLAAPGLQGLLVKALEASDAEVVKQALTALGECQPQSFEHLARALTDARWDVRQLAVRLVAAAKHTEAPALLEARLESEEDDLVRAELIEALAQLRGVA